MSLLQILEECPDNNINLLPDMPFMKEITENLFDINKYSLEDLLKSLQTYSYLNLNTKELVEEIIWRIGEKEELFNEYFEDSDKLYIIKDRINTITKCEFKSHIKFPCTKEDLSARFCKYDNCSSAVKSGNLRLLKWLRDNNCPWDNSTNPTLFNLSNWEQNEEFPWHEKSCTAAVYIGNLEILKFCKDNGAAWDTNTCVAAAYNGNFKILKWLKENGCPWNEDTCAAAVYRGNFEMLKWLKKNGCPWNLDTCVAASCGEHDEILDWIRENGFPFVVSPWMESELF